MMMMRLLKKKSIHVPRRSVVCVWETTGTNTHTHTHIPQRPMWATTCLVVGAGCHRRQTTTNRLVCEGNLTIPRELVCVFFRSCFRSSNTSCWGFSPLLFSPVVFYSFGALLMLTTTPRCCLLNANNGFPIPILVVAHYSPAAEQSNVPFSTGWINQRYTSFHDGVVSRQYWHCSSYESIWYRVTSLWRMVWVFSY